MTGGTEILNQLMGLTASWREESLGGVTLPEPSLLALGAIVTGTVLALWGGRLLRAIYVMSFIAAGAAMGIRMSRSFGLDPLIGLVLGGVAVGLAGYLMYRWWVGITAGVCAVVLVATVAGYRSLPEIQQELHQAFPDYRQGVGTDSYTLAPPAADESTGATFAGYVRELGRYYWETQRAASYRVVFVLGLALLTGLGMGLTLPRFTTIVGTSLVGVAFIAAGGGYLIWSRWPQAWSSAMNQVAWLLAALGLVTVISLAYQARQTGTSSMAAHAPASA